MEIEEEEFEESFFIPESLRWRIIGFIEGGKTQLEAAVQYGLDRKTVGRIQKKFNETGVVEDKPRSGRPKKMTKEEEEKIMKLLSVPNKSSRAVAKEMKTISKSTICNIAAENGYNYRHYIEIAKLSSEEKEARLKYCEAWLNKDHSNIVFSDESYFHLFRSTIGKWTKSKKIYAERIHSDLAVMVWGAICTGGKAKICILDFKKRVDQACYIQILSDYLLPFSQEQFSNKSWLFQQDNASVHRGNKTLDFLKANNITTLTHPPYSPDLNPIEMIWKMVKDSVESKSPTNLQELKDAIQSSWDSLEIGKINHAISHLKKRMQAVVAAQGEFI